MSAPEGPRIGRPARIDRDAIARAVLEIGVDDATIKRVAAHLGVSVPGLYYYVRGRDDLLRLAAELTLARTEPPVYEGQHWARWLREWARHTRSSMAANPTLLEQYLAGGLADGRIFASIGIVVEVLTDAGLAPEAAVAAWGVVGAVALGSAVQDVRFGTDDAAAWAERARAVLAGPDGVGGEALAAFLEAQSADRDTEFEDRLTTVLVGIAVRSGLPVDDQVTETGNPAEPLR